MEPRGIPLDADATTFVPLSLPVSGKRLSN
jgi:hypothetical protein